MSHPATHLGGRDPVVDLDLVGRLCCGLKRRGTVQYGGGGVTGLNRVHQTSGHQTSGHRAQREHGAVGRVKGRVLGITINRSEARGSSYLDDDVACPVRLDQVIDLEAFGGVRMEPAEEEEEEEEKRVGFW